MTNVPHFPYPGAAPTPGLDRLETLRQIARPGTRAPFGDDDGPVRSNLLAEAVFLFHKCAHTHLAAQRLGTKGMHSWCLFNAYHSAYLGARGVMALLGIGLPLVDSEQFLIDVFPQPTARKDQQRLAAGKWRFSIYDVVHFPHYPFKQEEVWEAFCRIVHVSNVQCWRGTAYDELRKLSDSAITRPRNVFLYAPTHWPLKDLLEDASGDAFAELFEGELDIRERGFLLRLSCDVYVLFQSLMVDLAKESGPIRLELEASRIAKRPKADDLLAYDTFLEHMSASDEASN